MLNRYPSNTFLLVSFIYATSDERIHCKLLTMQEIRERAANNREFGHEREAVVFDEFCQYGERIYERLARDYTSASAARQI